MTDNPRSPEAINTLVTDADPDHPEAEALRVAIERVPEVVERITAALRVPVEPPCTMQGYVPVAVEVERGSDRGLSMVVDHEGAPWMNCGDDDDVWTGELWVRDAQVIDAATAEVERAFTALRELRDIYDVFALGDDSDPASGADVCQALFELMGRIGLEVA